MRERNLVLDDVKSVAPYIDHVQLGRPNVAVVGRIGYWEPQLLVESLVTGHDNELMRQLSYFYLHPVDVSRTQYIIKYDEILLSLNEETQSIEDNIFLIGHLVANSQIDDKIFQNYKSIIKKEVGTIVKNSRPRSSNPYELFRTSHEWLLIQLRALSVTPSQIYYHHRSAEYLNNFPSSLDISQCVLDPPVIINILIGVGKDLDSSKFCVAIYRPDGGKSHCSHWRDYDVIVFSGKGDSFKYITPNISLLWEIKEKFYIVASKTKISKAG